MIESSLDVGDENYSCGKAALQCDGGGRVRSARTGLIISALTRLRTIDRRVKRRELRERNGKRNGVARAEANVVTRVYTYGLRGDVRSRAVWVRFCLTDGPQWSRVLAHRNTARCNATQRGDSRDATRGAEKARRVTRNLGFRIPGRVDSSPYLSPRPSYAPETTARQLRSLGKAVRMPSALEAIDTAGISSAAMHSRTTKGGTSDARCEA